MPLQTLYVNFTTQVLQAIGLGYGRPAEGLMQRKPRPVGRADPAAAAAASGSSIAGLVLGGATLGVIAWADDAYDSTVARTMGLTTFAISNVMFSLATRDERRSVFSLDVLEDRIFLLCSGGSLRRDPRSAPSSASCSGSSTPSHLDLHQWLVCIVVGLAIIPVSEGRRLLLERRSRAPGDGYESDDRRAVGA